VGLVAAVVAGALVAIGLCVFSVEPLWVLPVLEWITPNILYRVKTEKALVALSFDDGPHPGFTPQVLEILERYRAKATFFLIGERALRHPELVAQIQAAGHEIGNHYFKDGPMLGHSDAMFVEKLEETERAIEFALGQDGPLQKAGPTTEAWENGSEGVEHYTGKAAFPKHGGQASGRHTARLRFFRPPGGVAWPRQLRLARERGYTCVLGCAYPHDPMKPPVTYIRWLVKKNLAAGTIVILHDGIKDATRGIEALPDILAEGKRRGLRFVSIGALVDSCDARAADAREAGRK
jgi:peptidoglycan-N-acetylglucosamine deacetylase